MSDLLSKRLDVMQQEIRGLAAAMSKDIKKMNEDFHAVMLKYTEAIQALDARIDRLESSPGNDTPRESGVEL